MEDILQVREEYRLQQWGQIVQQCRESGMSNRDFCRQNGITEKTYYYWLRKLRMAAAGKDSPEYAGHNGARRPRKWCSQTA